jgi:plastocyanin
MVSAAEASLNGLPNLLARHSARRLRWRNIGRAGRRYRMAGSPINPGRKFQEADKGHNAESIKGMLAEGAAPFVGKNNEDIAVKFEQEGVYGIKCLPEATGAY